MQLDAPPKLTRKRNLAFALETTTGTAAALTGASGTTQVYDPAMPFTQETVERSPQGNLSPIAAGRGAKQGTCTLMSDLYGGSTAPWTPLLRACGVSLAAGVFKPVTGATETLTMGLYQMGRLKTLAGCMGDFTLMFRRGVAPRFNWTFSGVPQAPTDTTIITPTYVTTVAPRVVASFTIGGSVYHLPDVNFAAGNDVQMRESLADNGYRNAYVVNRNPTIQLAPEALPLSNRDWYAAYEAGTTFALSIDVGEDGNGWVFAAPKMELAGLPADGDRNGFLTDTLSFRCLRNSDLGDDEWTLTEKEV